MLTVKQRERRAKESFALRFGVPSLAAAGLDEGYSVDSPDRWNLRDLADGFGSEVQVPFNAQAVGTFHFLKL